MKLVAQPAEYPVVTVFEARQQCSLLDDQFDEYLERVVSVATKSCEQWTRTHFAKRSAVLYLDEFRDYRKGSLYHGGSLKGSIFLQTSPVISVESVVYDDPNGVEQALVEGTDYWADLYSEYPSIESVDCWPATQEKPNSIRITMTIGYADRNRVPVDVKHAILMRTAELFDKREETLPVNVLQEVKAGVRSLLEPYRLVFI